MKNIEEELQSRNIIKEGTLDDLVCHDIDRKSDQTKFWQQNRRSSQRGIIDQPFENNFSSISDNYRSRDFQFSRQSNNRSQYRSAEEKFNRSFEQNIDATRN